MLPPGLGPCYRLPLGRYAPVLQGSKALPASPTLFPQAHRFLRLAARSKVVALLIIRPAKPGRCRKAPETPHRIVALFHPPMILFHPIVEIAIRAMDHFASQYLADRPWVGVVATGRHSLWGATGHFLGLLEELLGRGHVSRLTEPGVHQVAVAVHSAIQIVPRAPDFDVGFVDVPGSARLAAAFGAQLLRDERGKVGF